MPKFEKFTKVLSQLWKNSNEANKILLAAIISVFLSGLVYQNCSNPAIAPSNSLASEASKIDFPYDSQIDQIAYMSCNQMVTGGYDASAYFSFRAGAYRAGSGVEVTTAFKNDIHVSGGAPAEQASLLAAIAAVATARPQLAIRSFSNFQAPFLATATSTGTDGVDFTTFFTPMDDPNFALAAINEVSGDGLKYVRNEAPQGARFEAAISLNNAYGTVRALEKSINSGVTLLTVTYQGQGGSFSARAPSDYGISTTSSTISAYGRGYQLTFRQPVGASSQYPTSTLASVSELNLESRSLPAVSGAWTCDPSMQFRVLRSNLTSDLKQAVCTMGVDDPNDAKLAIVRNSFRVEDWYVDMANRCLIPKKTGGGCYATSVGIPINSPQQVNGTYRNDYLNYSLGSPANPPGKNTNIFVEMASICYR